MAQFKPQRQARYDWLRAKHFAPLEAREFSKLTRQYPALKKMVKQRQSQFSAFERKARQNEWSPWKRGAEWVKYLKQFYGEERYRVHRDPKTGKRTLDAKAWVARKDVHPQEDAAPRAPATPRAAFSGYCGARVLIQHA